MKKRSIVIIIGEKSGGKRPLLLGGKGTKNPYTKQIPSCVKNIRIPKTIVVVPGEVFLLSSFLTSDTLK
jgi:hypothetical protein